MRYLYLFFVSFFIGVPLFGTSRYEEYKTLFNKGEYTKLGLEFKKLDVGKMSADVKNLYFNYLDITGKYEQLGELTKNDTGYWRIIYLDRVGRYDELKKVLKNAVRKNRHDLKIRALEGIYAKQFGDLRRLRRARKYFFREYASGNIKTSEELTLTAIIIGDEDPAGALRLFKEVIKKDKNFCDAYVGVVDLCLEFNSSNKASAFIKKGLAINPNHPILSLYDDEVERALKVNPNFVAAFSLQGIFMLLSDKPEACKKVLDKGAKVNPNSLDLLTAFAVYYNAEGSQKKRDEVIKKILKINPHYSDVFNILSDWEERKFRVEKAVEWAMKSIEVAPEHWRGYYLAGKNLLDLGEEQKGYQLLEKSFMKNKFNLHAYNILETLDYDFKYHQLTYYETEHFRIKLPKDDSYAIAPYLKEKIETFYDELCHKYNFYPKGTKESNGKILLIFFNSAEYFSSRIMGIPGIPATGVCFGRVILFPSPRVLGVASDDQFNWVSTVKHEFMHVISLQASNYKIPRWFTEGLSSWEETDTHFYWRQAFASALNKGLILRVENMEPGFTAPTYPGQVTVSYYQAMLICQFLNDTYGFKVILEMIKRYGKGEKTKTILPAVTKLSLDELNKKLMTYYKKHIASFKNSKRPKGVDELVKQIEKENKRNKVTNPPDMWYQVLAYYAKNKQYKRGIEYGKYLIKKGVEQYELYMFMGDFYNATGRPELAIKMYEHSLDINPFSLKLHLALYRLYTQKNELEKAKRECQILEQSQHN